ncbi:MAG: polymer-forming cytoskeletal protein [Rickettsiales bacterium]|nr:polymer-forming cytoskeletal protein [Rickettsiales bacterium]
MFKENTIIKNNSISVFSKNLEITGDIKDENVLEIEGKVKGNIFANHLTLRESSNVDGNIVAEEVILKGTFKGNVKSKKISISGKAKIHGKVEYGILSVEDGAEIFADLKRVTDFNINVIENKENKEVKENKEEAKEKK